MEISSKENKVKIHYEKQSYNDLFLLNRRLFDSTTKCKDGGTYLYDYKGIWVR